MTIPPLPPSPTVATTTTISPSSTTKLTLSPPINNFDGRLTKRWFGKYVTPLDNQGMACGKGFTGYHTGDDLEVSKEEINQTIPIYAIAEGQVKRIGFVSGYGGLIIIEHNLNGQLVTAYYGHIALSSSSLKNGDDVISGQQIAALGEQCSTQTDFERKHLHFAIHKGNQIDVRGYVPVKADLDAWLDPKKYF